MLRGRGFNPAKGQRQANVPAAIQAAPLETLAKIPCHPENE